MAGSGSRDEARIGERLVKDEVITREELDEAIAQSDKSGISWMRHLINTQRVPIKAIDDVLHYEISLGGPKRKRTEDPLGQALLKIGAITRDQLNKGLAEQKRTGRLLGRILLERGLVTPHVMAVALGKQYGIEHVELAKYPFDMEAVARLPENVARVNKVLAIKQEEGKLTVAVNDPRTAHTLDNVRLITGMEVEAVVAEEEDLLKAIDKCYKGLESKSMADVVAKSTAVVAPEPKARPHPPADQAPEDKARFAEVARMAENVPVVKMVATIIEGAVNARATDIHLDPHKPEMRVRYRIDGTLHDVMTIPPKIEPAVVSRLKILADMDITETRRPQDAHFMIMFQDRECDLRVATMPTCLGERITLRLLDPASVFKGLKELGLADKDMKTMEKLFRRPHGMILVTGPTGCGKTTTLYAALNQRDVVNESIITLEDPVEYQLSGINQVEINTGIDLTFAKTLRAALRQDVDTILVGEIRDVETAHIAIRAAMTGHLVFSTLHTNDAPEAVSTLYNMGIMPFLISSSVAAVVAQRLIRVICPDCKKKYKPSASVRKALKITDTKKYLYRGEGCPACFHSGYVGRTGVFEILEVTPAIRKMITEGEAVGKIAKAARLVPMAMKARDKVLKGVTTAEEYFRMTGGE